MQLHMPLCDTSQNPPKAGTSLEKSYEGQKNVKAPIIPVGVEAEMTKKIQTAADAGFGFPRTQVMVKTYQVVESMRPKHPIQNVKAGKSCFTRFKAWNESLSIRKAQKFCTSRQRMIMQNVVKSYFEDLGNILTSEGIKDTPTEKDESGFFLKHTPSSIVVQKGTSDVSGRVALLSYLVGRT